MVFLGCFTSLCYWPYETAWPNQSSVFQKCEPVVFARLGFQKADDGMLTNLHWLVWEHQALMLCHAHWKSFIADSLWDTDDSDWLLHNSKPIMLWTHGISRVWPSHWMRARKALLLHLFRLSGIGSIFFGLAWLGLAHNFDHFAHWQEHVSKSYKSFLLCNDAVSQASMFFTWLLS